MSVVLGKILHMKIILPNVDTEYNCKHEIKKNMFLLHQLKLIVLFHESMAFYNLSLWLDSLPWFIHKRNLRDSLVAQWFRIRLPMQDTRVRALVWEDPTCRGATKPVRHNYWARVPQLLKPVCLQPVLHNKRSHRNEKPAHRNEE